MSKERKMNAKAMITNPVLGELTDEAFMWTGIIKSENITPEIIRDDIVRKEFTELVQEYEGALLEYRKKQKNLINRVLDLSAEIKAAFDKMSKDNTISISLFWIQLCREYEEIQKRNPEEIRLMNRETKENFEILRKKFLGIKPLIREDFVERENKYVCKAYSTLSQESNYRKNTNNRDILKQVITSVSGKDNLSKEEEHKILQEVLGSITSRELFELFEYREFGKRQYITSLKNYLLKQGTSVQKIDSMEEYEIEEQVLEVYKASTEFDVQSSLIADIIINGIEYIDIEKLLLVAMIRPLKNLDLMELACETEEEVEFTARNEQYQEATTDSSDNYIQKEFSVDSVIAKTKRLESIIQKILKTNNISRKKKFRIQFRDREEEYSLANLETLMDKYVDGIYLTPPLEESLKYKGSMDPAEMSSWSDELIKKITFSNDDKYFLSMINFENLKRLYKLGIINKEYIKELLERSSYYFEHPEKVMEFEESDSDVDRANKIIKKNLIELLKDLSQAGMISDQEINEYIKSGTITLQMIQTLGELPSERARKIITQENVLEIYKRYVEKYLEFVELQKNHPKKTEEIKELKEKLEGLRTEKDKARELFLKYNSDLSEEEWKNLGNELLETYYIKMEVVDETLLQESVKVLYEDGLIDLENIIYLNKNYIIPMLDTLSLEDAEKVKKSMSFKELKQLLDSIFENDEFSDERKFIIVMNFLGEDTEEENEAKKLYLSLLDFDDESEKKAKPTGKKRDIIDGGHKESKKYIYPDVIKWRFFKAIDNDIRVTRYSNGYVEFASKKLGCRILEKYYDKNEPAYGTATFILPEQVYRKNQGNLITDLPKGQIVEPVTLREITPRQDRITHRTHSPDKTWMDGIIKYLEKNHGLVIDKKLEEFVRNNKTKYDELIK